jgi:hypothetical protein
MASIISAGTTSGTALNMTGDTSGQLQLATGATPTTAVTIDTSQNVGIGTSSPSAKLDVNGFINTSQYLKFGSSSNLLYQSATTVVSLQIGTTPSYLAFVDSSGSPTISGPGGVLAFGTGGSNTERMRIDSSGSLAIGTSSALGKMSIYWNNTTQQGFTLQASTTTFNGSPIVFFNSSGGLSGFIGQTSTTVTYNTSSDYRLKENVLPMTGALDKVIALKPVTYKWKVDGSDGQGFIAHELQAIVPDCVTGEKDAVNEDGSIKPQGIDTSFLVATLTAAIQEMKAIIDAQSARITALENK